MQEKNNNQTMQWSIKKE